MQTIPDSNVILDVFGATPGWFEWSTRMLKACRLEGRMIINLIVYAEISAGYPEVSQLDQLLRQVDIERDEIPWAAAHIAGRAHYVYRRRGGARDRVLPDFLIGAHALVSGYRLLTRDGARYRSYFPSIDIIAPDTHP